MCMCVCVYVYICIYVCLKKKKRRKERKVVQKRPVLYITAISITLYLILSTFK